MRVAVRCGGYTWRPLTASDEDTAFVCRLRNDPRFSQMFYHRHVTPEQHRAFIQRADERGEVNWLIEDPSGEPMGLGAIYNFDYPNRKAECGRIAMLDPRLFHRNWMVSAFAGMEVIGTIKLYIETLEENSIVARGLERIGMDREGLLHWHVIRDGKPLNVWYFGGTSELWFRVKDDLCRRFGDLELISFEGRRMVDDPPVEQLKEWRGTPVASR
jgi:RimJ/RimL family protein N-acetyltransferase